MKGTWLQVYSRLALASPGFPATLRAKELAYNRSGLNANDEASGGSLVIGTNDSMELLVSSNRQVEIQGDQRIAGVKVFEELAFSTLDQDILFPLANPVNGQALIYDETTGKLIWGDGGGGGTGDHSLLTNLNADDHLQYHTDARGDARYSLLGHDHAGVYEPANANIQAHIGTVSGNPHNVLFSELSDAPATMPPSTHTHNEHTGRDASDCHPISAITGLDSRISTDEANLNTHLLDYDNPHAVTAAQTGAAPAVHTHLEVDITDLNRLRWMGEWVQQQYVKNDVVRDGGWTQIANKTTEERAAPQPIGSPWYYYEGTIGEAIVSAKQVIFGNRYTMAVDGFLNGYRVYTKIGNTYKVYISEDLDTTPIITGLITFAATEDGWTEFTVQPSLIFAGVSFDLIVTVQEPDPTPTIWSGNWNYVTENNITPPLNGEIRHSDKALGSLRISTQDDDGGDRYNELNALTVGDLIEGAGLSWAIQSITPQVGYFDFGISPATMGIAGVGQFDFHTVSETPITYGVDADHWIADPNAQGLLGVDTDYSNIVPDDNAYGIDVYVQQASVPTDWDTLAFNSGNISGGGGGGGDGTFIGLSDTPADYAGNAGKLVKVDPTGAFLIFGDPSGTSVSWGDILGTLSNQTDLQAELNNRSLLSHNHDSDYDALGAAATVQGNLDTHVTNSNNPHQTSWSNLVNAPTSLPPDAHTHPLSEITDNGAMAYEDDAASDGNEYVRKNGAWAVNTGEPAITDHRALSNIGPDEHHAQSHSHNGADGSGTVSHTDLSDIGSNTHAQIDTHIADTNIHFGDAVEDGSAYLRRGNVGWIAGVLNTTFQGHVTNENGHHDKSHTHDGVDGSGIVAYSSLSGIPATFPPSAHNHTVSEITDIADHYIPLVGTTTPVSGTVQFTGSQKNGITIQLSTEDTLQTDTKGIYSQVTATGSYHANAGRFDLFNESNFAGANTAVYAHARHESALAGASTFALHGETRHMAGGGGSLAVTGEALSTVATGGTVYGAKLQAAIGAGSNPDQSDKGVQHDNAIGLYIHGSANTIWSGDTPITGNNAGPAWTHAGILFSDISLANDVPAIQFGLYPDGTPHQLHLDNSRTYIKANTSGDIEFYVNDVLVYTIDSGGGEGGATTFLELTDTPADYSGQAGKLVKVDPTGNFLIFGDPSGTTVSWGDIQGTLSDQTDLQNVLDAKSDATHNHDSDYDALGAAAAVQSNLDTHTGNTSIHFDDAVEDGSAYLRRGNVGWVAGVDNTTFQAHATNDNAHHAKAHAHDGLDGSGIIDYANLANIPATYPPAAHTHTVSDITDAGTLAYVNDAPNDGKQYARQSLAWAEVTGGGGIEEAPIDGSPYSRQDAGWVLSPTGGGGGGSMTVSDTPPSNPGNGDQWLDSKTGIAAVWYTDGTSDQWVSDPYIAEEVAAAFVTSVNGDVGPDVVLDHTDVGAEPANANIQSHIGITDGNPHGTDYLDVGAEPANTNIQTHIGRTDNPHGVTAAQAGAEPANVNIQTHIGTIGNPHGTTTDDLGAVASNTVGLTMEVVAALPGTPNVNTLYIVTG